MKLLIGFSKLWRCRRFMRVGTRFTKARSCTLAAWLAGLLIVHLTVLAFLSYTPRITYTILNSTIVPEEGLAFSAPIPSSRNALYALQTDSVRSPFRSKLLLFDDGKPLGPAHVVHAEIRKGGNGNYSHWESQIIFSTPDGSDPRTNGHTYSIASPTVVRPPLKAALWACLLLIDAAWIFVLRQQIPSFLRKNGHRLCVAFAVFAVTAAALASFGVFGDVVLAKAGTAADATLCFETTVHACLGCFLAFAIWAGGAGVVRLFMRNPRADLASILIPGFPAGLALLAALTAIGLTAPSGRAIAPALWAASLLPLINWRPPAQQMRTVLKAAAGIVPFALAFAVWLGLLWHGPTDTLSGSPSGDLTDYAGTIWSFANSPYPRLDFGYESGATRSYFNTLYSALGAVLLHLPGFDPFLYLIAGGAASYVLFSAVMLHLYLADCTRRSTDLLSMCVLLLAFLVAARYPYWVVESVPVIFAPALTIAVLWMSERGKDSFGWMIAAAITGLGGSALTKVVSAITLVPLGVASLWQRFWLLPNSVRVAMFTIGVAACAYSLAMLFSFAPVFVGLEIFGPESLRFSQWWFVSRDLATIALACLVWFVAEAGTALALTCGLFSFLLFSFLFQINFACATIVMGLLTFTSPLGFVRRSLVAATFVLALPAVILSDPAGTSTGVVWIICLGGAVLIATSSAISIEGLAALTLRMTAATAMTTLAVSGLLLVGVARGLIIADSGYHLLTRPLTPALKDIWSAVRRFTPNDSLIFTDQVDETINVLGGWNTFAFSGQRQIYLSSYYTAFELRKDRAKLRETLAINDSVLAGIQNPSDIKMRRQYENIFAVVSKSRQTPASWRKIYINNDYGLFRISP